MFLGLQEIQILYSIIKISKKINDHLMPAIFGMGAHPQHVEVPRPGIKPEP